MSSKFTSEEEAAWAEYDESQDPKVRVWGKFGNFELVGNGEVTSDKCGRFVGWSGCARVELHNVVLDGGDFGGKVFARLKHKSCFNPRCPTCYLSWAQREARKATAKLKGYMLDGLGVVEHVIVSLPSSDYGLSYQQMVSKFLKVCKRRGVLGGAFIFHAFRYADPVEAREKGVPFGWRFEPHFHVIGFVLNAGQCRSCRSRWNCLSCEGFFGAVKRGHDGYTDQNNRFHKGDGYVVKLAEKRESIHGTLWYQLNHATLDISVPKFHVLRWFGVCHRSPKHKVLEELDVCPCCKHELVDLCYSGRDALLVEAESLNKSKVARGFPRWHDFVEPEYGECWYEKPN